MADVPQGRGLHDVSCLASLTFLGVVMAWPIVSSLAQEHHCLKTRPGDWFNTPNLLGISTACTEVNCCAFSCEENRYCCLHCQSSNLLTYCETCSKLKWCSCSSSSSCLSLPVTTYSSKVGQAREDGSSLPHLL